MKKRFTIDQIIKILAEAETPGNSVAGTAPKIRHLRTNYLPLASKISRLLRLRG